MATILYCSAAGAGDPTRVSLPFAAAIGTVKSGHQAQIALAGEAVALLKDGIAEHIQGEGKLPLSELLETVQALKVPVYICAECSAAHGVSSDDLLLLGQHAQLISIKDFEALSAAADVVLPVAPA